jgi:hypothetical protein
MPDWPTLQGVISSHAVEFLRVMAVPTHWSESGRDQQHTQGLFNPHSPPPLLPVFSTGVVPREKCGRTFFLARTKMRSVELPLEAVDSRSDPSCPAQVREHMAVGERCTGLQIKSVPLRFELFTLQQSSPDRLRNSCFGGTELSETTETTGVTGMSPS